MQGQITLFLMTRKGFKVLEALGKEFRELIDFVVTQRDKSVQDDYYAEIRELCEQLNIPCYDRQQSYKIQSKYALAISWRWLINLKETTLIIFHDSLLPKYRGFNPLVSYLINGENRIGVTALFAADTYDTGDIIAQAGSEISYPKKVSEAIEIVSDGYVKLARQIAAEINRGTNLIGKPQNEAEASYSLWRDEEDYQINWSHSAQEIRRFVDAVGFPYKGAFTLINGKRARVFDIEELDDMIIENRIPGKVIFIKESSPIVVCGRGLAKIKTLVDDETGESLLPLRNLRLRFK
jgi:methionyl-tRNA formyltransferase